MYNMVVGLILFLLIGIISGHWGEAAIAGIIVGVIVFMFQEDAADMRAYYNRRDYWAYGKAPDWKRRQRVEKVQAERDSARLQNARQAAAAGRWDEVPWSLRGKIRKEQEDHDAWMAEQERLATEKRRAYMEQMRAKRR